MSVSAGFSVTMRAVAAPPFEAMIRRLAGDAEVGQRGFEVGDVTLHFRADGGRERRRGKARSNSRNCGDMNDEVVTKASGITSSTIARARSSWAEVEKRKKEADDDGLDALCFQFPRRAAGLPPHREERVPCPSGGARGVRQPSCRWRRAAGGRFCQGSSCMME